MIRIATKILFTVARVSRWLFELWLRMLIGLFHLAVLFFIVASAVCLVNFRTVDMNKAWPVWIATASFLGVYAFKEHLGGRPVPLNGKGLGISRRQEDL